MTNSSEIGANLARLRKRRGLTLDGLAELSSVSRAAISALENGASNPRLETLWSLANALGIEFGELVGGRNDVEVVEADGISARLIDRQTRPRTVEAFLLDLPANAKRHADAHVHGVSENVVVLSGTIAVGPLSAPMLLHAGQSHQFAADVPHIYSAGAEPSRAIVTIVYPEDDTALTAEDQDLEWPVGKDEWENVRAQLNRARVEVQNGCAHSRITFKNAPESLPSATRLLEDELATRSGIAETARIFVTRDLTPTIATFYRTAQMRPLPINEQIATPLITNCRELACAAVTPWLANGIDPDDLQIRSQSSKHIIEAALAAEVLTRLGRPTVPIGISQKRVTPKQSIMPDRMFEDRIDVDAYEAYELVHPAYARQVLAVAEMLPVLANKTDQTILDIGTGPGLALEMLLELRPELRAVAIDPSEIANVHLCRRFAGDDRVQAVHASIPDYRPADRTFEAAVSIGASQHLDTKQFLSSIHECLAAGGVLVIADEMLTPFRDRRQRNLALITHHLWYILDTLFKLPASSSETERAVCDILRQGLPPAMSLALSGRSEAAARQVRETFETAMEIDLGDVLVAREAVFNRFHLLELQALVAGLDYEVEQKTFPARFVSLAESSGFSLLQHRRIYATQGDGSYDAGTHLFVMVKQ
jgi:transcriptional regulator with XRE-family HTH domain/SAM-dependent methyltransferase